MSARIRKASCKVSWLVNNASSLLHRRLSKNVKYFDSGDYNMAKSKPLEKASLPLTNLDSPTGDTIPTVDNICVLRNKSISLHAGSTTNTTTITIASSQSPTSSNPITSNISTTSGAAVTTTTTTTTCRYITIPARTQIAK
ncbi:unnamed protein product [Heterobilharzia americana]|nr:unnamed protein product [Heterobilharzia americana]